MTNGRTWNPDDHPRHPAGTPVDDSTGAGGGRFTSAGSKPGEGSALSAQSQDYVSEMIGKSGGGAQSAVENVRQLQTFTRENYDPAQATPKDWVAAMVGGNPGRYDLREQRLMGYWAELLAARRGSDSGSSGGSGGGAWSPGSGSSGGGKRKPEEEPEEQQEPRDRGGKRQQKGPDCQEVAASLHKYVSENGVTDQSDIDHMLERGTQRFGCDDLPGTYNQIAADNIVSAGKSFDPDRHPRHPEGTAVDDGTGAGGGRFRKVEEGSEPSPAFDFEGADFDPERQRQNSLLPGTVPAVQASENVRRRDVDGYDPIVRDYVDGLVSAEEMADWLEAQLEGGEHGKLRDIIPVDVMVDLCVDLGIDDFDKFRREFLTGAPSPAGGAYTFPAYDQSWTNSDFVNAFMERVPTTAEQVSWYIEDAGGEWPFPEKDMLKRVVDPLALPGAILALDRGYDDYAAEVADMITERNGGEFDSLHDSLFFMRNFSGREVTSEDDARYQQQYDAWLEYRGDADLPLEDVAENNDCWANTEVRRGDLSRASKAIFRDYMNASTVAESFDGQMVGGEKIVGTISGHPNRDYKGGMLYSASIIDGGETIGTFQFSVIDAAHADDPEDMYPVVHVDYVEINGNHQNKGLALDLMSGVARFAEQQGLDTIELQADITIGRYAWAKYGFDFAPGYEFDADKFASWMDDRGIDHENAKDANGDPIDLGHIETAEDLADFDIPGVRVAGSDITNFGVNDDAQMKVGKAYMLDGVIDYRGTPKTEGLGWWMGETSPRDLRAAIATMRDKKGLGNSAQKSIKGGRGSGYFGPRPGRPGHRGGSLPRGSVSVEFDYRSQERQGEFDLEGHFGISEEDIEKAIESLALPGTKTTAIVVYNGRGELLFDVQVRQFGRVVAKMQFRLINGVLATHTPSAPETYHALDGIEIDHLEMDDAQSESAAGILLPVLAMARDAGYRVVSFDVDGDAGRYGWAKYGMDFGDPTKVPEYNARFQQWLQRHGLAESEKPYMTKPADFASYASKIGGVKGSAILNPHINENAELAAGKGFLLDRLGMPRFKSTGDTEVMIQLVDGLVEFHNWWKERRKTQPRRRRAWEPIFKQTKPSGE